MNNVDIKDYAQFIGASMLVKGLSVSPLKLQKILYYQQAWHMVAFGRRETLLNSLPHAWVNGPVYPEIYYVYKHMVPGMCDHLTFKHFSCSPDTANGKIVELISRMQLTQETVCLSDRVNLLYGARTQNQLILMTHSEKPWSEMREGLAPYEYSDRKISLDTMYHYYKDRYDRNRSEQ